MIFIDKSKAIQTLVLTLNEQLNNLTGDYILTLTSDGDRGVFTFILDNNLTIFPERFDLFKIETDVFSELSDGIYSYSVNIQSTEIETGKALVKSPAQPSSAVIQPNSTIEKILMYGN